MDKECVLEFTVNKNDGPRTYWFYSDSTYKASSFSCPEDCSEWKIKRKQLYYRHRMSSWQPWSNGKIANIILNKLDIDRVIQQFLTDSND